MEFELGKTLPTIQSINNTNTQANTCSFSCTELAFLQKKLGQVNNMKQAFLIERNRKNETESTNNKFQLFLTPLFLYFLETQIDEKRWPDYARYY